MTKNSLADYFFFLVCVKRKYKKEKPEAKTIQSN